MWARIWLSVGCIHIFLVPQVLLQSQSMHCEKQRRIMQRTSVQRRWWLWNVAFMQTTAWSLFLVLRKVLSLLKSFASWLRRVDSGWRSGSATVDMSWTPFQHQREQKTWRRWIWVVRNFHLKGPWVSCGQWSTMNFQWKKRFREMVLWACAVARVPGKLCPFA